MSDSTLNKLINSSTDFDVNEEQEDISKKQEFRNLQDSGNLNHSDVNLFRKSMNYEARRKLFSKVPKSLSEAKVMIYKYKTDFFFSKSEQFCFMESADSIPIFKTASNLLLLNNAQHVFADSTFSRVHRDKYTQDQFDKDVTNFIIYSMIPLRTAENPFFKKIFENIGITKKINVPSRRNLGRKIHNLFEDNKEKIINDIKDIKYVCTTTDVWSSKKRSFLGVTIHWIDVDNFERPSSSLACRRFRGTHSYDRTGEILQDIHLEYNLDSNKIIATITDNGSNFVKAFKAFGVKLTHFDNVEDSVYENIDLYSDVPVDSQGRDDEQITYNSAETTEELENSPWLPRHLRYCAHTLSLFVTTDLIKTIRSPQNSQLNEIHTSVMKKCTLLWNASYRPKSAEIILQTLGHKLSRPGDTRWNSLYDFLKQILKNKEKNCIIIQGQDDITNNPGNNYDTTSTNIGDLIKEPEPNTKISVASVLKKCPRPSDISQNLNNEPTHQNLTFYPKTNIPSVSVQINEGHLKLIKENRKYIKRIASVLLYTGTQCIAQRGDDESVKSLNRGNFLELLHLIDEQCEAVSQDVPQNAKYTSPQIQNEMISIFNQIILEKISFELQSCNYFALIVDETKDISKTEQLSLLPDISKNISDVKLFFDLVEEIYVFVSGSAVHSLFVDIQKKINLHSVVELEKICLTRWTAQVFATLVLKKVLSPLLMVLHKLINDKGDRSVTVKGLLHQIDFIFVLNLVVFSNILTMFKKVSDFLQGVIAEIAESMVLIKSLIMTLKNMRNDSNDCLNECDGSINYICFEKMYEEALYICRENNIPLPSEQIQNIRKKRVPQKFKSFFIDEIYH
ncbi:hypothetical protein QTP88_019307 [Uroleucon formosanum]